MVTIFTVCAVVGSVIVVVQFLLTLAGVGHDFGDDLGDAHVELDYADAGHHGGHFFGLLSFRALVAAIAVFGLAGLAANAAGLRAPSAFMVSLAGGAVALVAVAWIMRFMYSLKDDGTVHIERAIGHQGTVYLTIPADRAGQGKVLLNLQNRTVECLAVTNRHDSLPAGAPVVVVAVLGPNMVEVEPWVETMERENAIHA